MPRNFQVHKRVCQEVTSALKEAAIKQELCCACFDGRCEGHYGRGGRNVCLSNEERVPCLALSVKGSQGVKLINFLWKFRSDVKALYQNLNNRNKLDRVFEELKDVFDAWNKNGPEDDRIHHHIHSIFKTAKSKDNVPIIYLIRAFVYKYDVIKKILAKYKGAKYKPSQPSRKRKLSD